VLRNARDGPLPPLLMLLTIVTGLVEAASFLRLGRSTRTGRTSCANFSSRRVPSSSCSRSRTA
jgi:hypothetical protein